MEELAQPYKGYVDLACTVVFLQRDSGWRCSVLVEQGLIEWEGDNFRIYFKYYSLANTVSTKLPTGFVGRLTIDVLGMMRLPPFLYEAMECDFKRKEITIYGSARWLLQKKSLDSTGIPTRPTPSTVLPTRAVKRVPAKV